MDLMSILTGGGWNPQQQLQPLNPVAATAPINAAPMTGLADVVGAPAPAPDAGGWLTDPAKREQLSAIFSALSGEQGSRSGTQQLGAALTVGNQVKLAREAQNKKEARDTVLEGQHDVQAGLTLEKGQYELDKAKKVDPIALKTAELAYQSAATDADRKKAEYDLFQIYGAKKYEAEIAKLRAEANSAQTTAAKGANDLKGETAPWGTEEHMGAMRRNASVVKSFTTTEMVQDPTTGLSTPVATFNEAAFQDWYQKNQGAYPKAADVKAGKAKAGKVPSAAETPGTVEYYKVKYPNKPQAAYDALVANYAKTNQK